MTPHALLEKANRMGVRVRLNGANLRIHGESPAIQRLAPELAKYKAALVAHLRDPGISAQVREFMEVDGMTLEEAQAWEGHSVATRPASEWLDLIQELDALIDRYCAERGTSPSAHAEMRAARNRQPLATIPETLEWFKASLIPNNQG